MTSKKGVKISQLWLQAPVLLHFLAEASSTLMQFPTEKKYKTKETPSVDKAQDQTKENAGSGNKPEHVYCLIKTNHF